MFRQAIFLALSVAFAVPTGAMGQTIDSYIEKHHTNDADVAAIRSLLTTYTTSVSSGDQSSFRALLLDDQVPFSSTDSVITSRLNGQPVETRRYAEFRESIFESGIRFSQEFFNVHIEQDGPLAAVSLDFVTKELSSGKGGFG